MAKSWATEERTAPSGTPEWRAFMAVIEAGRGGQYGRVPRGGHGVGANPTSEFTRLPEEWDADVSHATHVVYHFGTPVAWLDGRRNTWVIPPVDYTPQTTGVQNRIREHIGAGNYCEIITGLPARV